MRAISTNQIADILRFNDKYEYLLCVSRNKNVKICIYSSFSDNKFQGNFYLIDYEIHMYIHNFRQAGTQADLLGYTGHWDSALNT